VKKKILVVDDEHNVTTFLKSYLEDTGHFEVRAENSGEMAYEAAKLFHPDLILLDVMMKGGSGDGLAARLKNDPNLRKTPIVFLTGIVTKEEVEANGGVIGGYPYIAKPILAMSELLECINANIR
jgi:two-component system alkaline phosphatase synthesis response regulator PhoP